MAAVTSADIVNRAVQFVGGFNNQKPVTGSPPSFDGSVVGIAAGQLYNGVVQTVGRQFGWDFSRRIAALALTINVPPLGFSYEYLYPTNGIQVRQLVPPTFTDPNDPRPVQWSVGNTDVPTTAATGSVAFASNPLNNDTVTLNGVVFTFVSGTPSGNQVQIGGTTAFTIESLAAALNASVNPSLTVATYVRTGGPSTASLNVTYDTLGTVGNAYTLAASAGTPSAATLTGGTTTQQKVIWTNLQNATATFTNQPGESIWDALFTESVVRLLASELDLATAGNPDRSALALGQAGTFEQMGQERIDS